MFLSNLFKTSGKGYFKPVAQLKRITLSLIEIKPSDIDFSYAAIVAAPSGHKKHPSTEATLSLASIISSSETDKAKPLLSLMALMIKKSPTATGTLIPAAFVYALSHKGACSSPFSHALTIGAQPSA